MMNDNLLNDIDCLIDQKLILNYPLTLYCKKFEWMVCEWFVVKKKEEENLVERLKEMIPLEQCTGNEPKYYSTLRLSDKRDPRDMERGVEKIGEGISILLDHKACSLGDTVVARVSVRKGDDDDDGAGAHLYALAWNGEYIENPPVADEEWELCRLAELESRNLYRAQLEGETPGSNPSVRLCTWNILAPVYARKTMDQLAAAGLNTQFHMHEGRRPLMEHYLNVIKADVLCLQEVSLDVYEKFLCPWMHHRQYQGNLFLKETKADEGVAIIFSQRKFKKIHSEKRIFKQETLSNPDLMSLIKTSFKDQSEHFIQKILKRMSCVLGIVVLSPIDSGDQTDSPAPCPLLCIMNSHFYWHPLGDHMRILQSYFVLRECDRIVKKFGDHVRIVFSGDLNSVPGAGAIQLLTEGFIEADHPSWIDANYYIVLHQSNAERQDDEGTESDKPHDLLPKKEEDTLKNTIGGFRLKAPGSMQAVASETTIFTNDVGPQFREVLDWIMIYNPAGVEPPAAQAKTSAPSAPSRASVEWILSGPRTFSRNGLPSASFPSDHVPLVAEVAFF